MRDRFSRPAVKTALLGRTAVRFATLACVPLMSLASARAQGHDHPHSHHGSHDASEVLTIADVLAMKHNQAAVSETADTKVARPGLRLKLALAERLPPRWLDRLMSGRRRRE